MSLETNHYVWWSIFVSLRIFSFPNWIKHYIQTAKLDLAYGVCVHVINVFFRSFSDVFFAYNYHYSNINRVNNRFQVLGIRWPPHLCFDRLTCSYLDDSAIDTLYFIRFTFSNFVSPCLIKKMWCIAYVQNFMVWKLLFLIFPSHVK